MGFGREFGHNIFLNFVLILNLTILPEQKIFPELHSLKNSILFAHAGSGITLSPFTFSFIYDKRYTSFSGTIRTVRAAHLLVRFIFPSIMGAFQLVWNAAHPRPLFSGLRS